MPQCLLWHPATKGAECASAAMSECTPGLDHLAEVQCRGRSLFHGDRTPWPRAVLYPTVQNTSFEPQRIRGTWVPGLGLLPPYPVVNWVFPNALAGALAAVTQNEDGAVSLHADEFPDGLVAITFGENRANRGAFQELVRRTARLQGVELAGNYFVNVLPRHVFLQEGDSPFPGTFISTTAVPVLERVQLSAGDVRALARILGELPWHDQPESVHAAPFTGPFSTGGQLQYDRASGERELLLRTPEASDRRASLAAVGERGLKWLRRLERPPLSSLAPSAIATAHAFGTKFGTAANQDLVAHWASVFGAPRSPEEVPDGVAAVLGRVRKYIEDHCTEPVTMDQLTQIANISKTRLHLMFHGKFGCTPREYAAERRVELAERLLQESRLSVAEISERCGFAEQASLTRSLKRLRGVTPSSLRSTAEGSDKI